MDIPNSSSMRMIISISRTPVQCFPACWLLLFVALILYSPISCHGAAEKLSLTSTSGQRSLGATKNQVFLWMQDNKSADFQPQVERNAVNAIIARGGADKNDEKVAKQHVDPWIPSNVFVCALAFLSAANDVIAQKRHDCFVSMMTGNMVRMANTVVEFRWHDTFHALVVVISYTVGIALFQIVSQLATRLFRAKRQWNDSALSNKNYDSSDKAAMTVIVAPLVLLVMGSGGLLSLRNISANNIVSNTNDKSNSLLGLFLMAVGGGLVNAAAMNATGGVVIYACTGHISKIGKALGQLMVDRQTLGKQPGLALSLQVVVSFGVGAISTVAAWNYSYTSSFPWFATLGVLHAILLGLYGFPAFCNTIRSLR